MVSSQTEKYEISPIQIERLQKVPNELGHTLSRGQLGLLLNNPTGFIMSLSRTQYDLMKTLDPLIVNEFLGVLSSDLNVQNIENLIAGGNRQPYNF